MKRAANMSASVASFLVHGSNNCIARRRLAAAARFVSKSTRRPLTSGGVSWLRGSETSMSTFLEKHREQAQDRHVDAELGNRRMAEQFRKPRNTHDPPNNQQHHHPPP